MIIDKLIHRLNQWIKRADILAILIQILAPPKNWYLENKSAIYW